MNGQEMYAIRQRLGFTRLALAREIGYTGTDRNDTTLIRRYENGQKQIPLYIARLVWLLDRLDSEGYRVNENCLVLWPHWPGYEYEHTPDAEVASTNG